MEIRRTFRPRFPVFDRCMAIVAWVFGAAVFVAIPVVIYRVIAAGLQATGAP